MKDSNIETKRRRIVVDKDVEVIVRNNTFYRFVYENNRIMTSFDMEKYGDEEYVTVGELRTMVNSNRKIFEDFIILIVDILDDNYTLYDLLIYLGLEKKYDEYFSVASDYEEQQIGDLKTFITKSSADSFIGLFESMGDKLRSRVIDMSIKLFKLGKFNDYSKMQIIRKYTSDEIFLDAEDTEIDIHM